MSVPNEKPPVSPETARLIRQKLDAEIGKCEFRDLLPHAHRAALFLVETTVELIEVAHSIALDDAETVQAFIESGELRRPSAAELSRWNDLPETPFRSVIVQPYVLAQRHQPKE